MTLSPLAKKLSHALVPGIAGGLAYLVGALGSGHFPGWKIVGVGFLCATASRLAGSILARIETSP